MHSRLFGLVVIGFVVATAGSSRFGLRADDSQTTKPEKRAASAASVVKGVSAAEEKAAFEFARAHHPELAALLEQLKTSAPQEYAAAIIDLDRSRQRVERNLERMPEQYALELAEWKINSRIRLLVARLTMGADAALKDELRAAIQERLDVRTKLLELEQDRLTRRLEKLNEQLAQQRSKSEELVDRDLAGLLNSTTAKTAKPVRTQAASKSNSTKDGVNAKPAPVKSPAKSPPKSAPKTPQKAAEKTPAKPTNKPDSKAGESKKSPEKNPEKTPDKTSDKP